jgi:hypothetical protein
VTLEGNDALLGGLRVVLDHRLKILVSTQVSTHRRQRFYRPAFQCWSVERCLEGLKMGGASDVTHDVATLG